LNSPADLAAALLRKAGEDRFVAERLMEDPGSPAWAIGFHAQQAVEKALKAVLSQHGIEFPRTHNLALLVELLRRAGLEVPPGSVELDQLIPFGVTLRYDDLGNEGLAMDSKVVRALMQRVLEWAGRSLSGDEPQGGP
jgi:HEPN domain-containing protein